MAAVDDVDQLIEQYHLGADEFLKGIRSLPARNGAEIGT
jgi:hypothetical protein